MAETMQKIIGISLLITSLNLSIASPLIAQSKNDYPVVSSAEVYPDIKQIWSKIVQIKDPYEGDYLAIFDRNDIQFNPTLSNQVISVWTRQKVNFVLRYEETIIRLYLKLGDHLFILEGKNNVFEINDELAMELANALSNKRVTIRLVLDNGIKINSDIGEETVKAWNVLYQIPKSSKAF